MELKVTECEWFMYLDVDFKIYFREKYIESNDSVSLTVNTFQWKFNKELWKGT